MQAPLPSRPTGRFSYDADTGKWDWDDEVFRIHGHAPGSVRPTTDLVMESKHPEDRDRVLAVLERASHTGDPFAISYRILAADDKERRVVLVGEGGMCEPGDTALVQGYYIDLSADVEQIVGHEIHDAVEATVEARLTIEQAKGAIMLAYGLDADAAFAMLRWWSRNRNVKVRELASRLVGVAQEGGVAFADLRLRVDALLHDLTEDSPNGYHHGMTEHRGENADEGRVDSRAELLPEEQTAGSEDPHEQAEQILRESDERVQDPEGTGARSVQTSSPDERPSDTDTVQ
jgi:hypothetical protein